MKNLENEKIGMTHDGMLSLHAMGSLGKHTWKTYHYPELKVTANTHVTMMAHKQSSVVAVSYYDGT